MNTLLLDSSYRPVDVIPWQRAICLLVQFKAEVIEEGLEEVRSARKTFKVPKILRLIKKHIFYKEAAFTKRNLFLRDLGCCGYCQEVFPNNKLTVDHIIPKCQGGVNNFLNTVSACFACNNRKGGRTPDQANMPLKIKPWIPTAFDIMLSEIKNTPHYENWISRF